VGDAGNVTSNLKFDFLAPKQQPTPFEGNTITGTFILFPFVVQDRPL